MQERTIPLSNVLTRGLVPVAEAHRSGFATEYTFAKPTQYGLRAPSTISQLTTVASWPLPQLIRGRGITLLATASRLYTVNESDWSLTTLLPASSFSVADVWHFVDLNEVWLLLNGNTVIYKTHANGMFGETDTPVVSTALTINTGCAFKGRMVLGGFNPANYWSSAWKTVFEELLQDFPFEIDTTMQAGTNYVAWSTIGGGDIFDLFLPETAINGHIIEDADRTVLDGLFMERWRRNELGIRPMPFQGAVQQILPLGNTLIVYGKDGIVKMQAVSEPTPTFAQVKLEDFGIPCRGAAGGHDKQHICVAEDGTLFSITNELQRLGYKEYLAELLDYPIAVTYNKRDEEFYIAGRDTDGAALTYCLNKQGLSRTPYRPTSLVYTGGVLCGVYDTATSTEVLYTSDVIDFGYRDLKTVNAVELSLELGTGAIAYLAFDYRQSSTAAWQRTAWVRFNDNGYAYRRTSGVEFRVCLKITNYTGLSIDRIAVKMQATSKLTVRGIYAAETGTGADNSSLG